MTTAAGYRRKGEECLEIAETLPQFRDALNDVADAWFMLAAEGVVEGIFAKMSLQRREA